MSKERVNIRELGQRLNLHYDPMVDQDKAFDDLSDAELWRAFRRRKSSAKFKRILNFEHVGRDLLKAAIDSPLHEKSQTHYQFKLDGDVVDYFPGTGMWSWRGKKCYGHTNSLINWYLKHKRKLERS